MRFVGILKAVMGEKILPENRILTAAVDGPPYCASRLTLERTKNIVLPLRNVLRRRSACRVSLRG
jgi:hypothetical protein